MHYNRIAAFPDHKEPYKALIQKRQPEWVFEISIILRNGWMHQLRLRWLNGEERFKLNVLIQ